MKVRRRPSSRATNFTDESGFVAAVHEMTGVFRVTLRLPSFTPIVAPCAKCSVFAPCAVELALYGAMTFSVAIPSSLRSIVEPSCSVVPWKKPYVLGVNVPNTSTSCEPWL